MDKKDTVRMLSPVSEADWGRLEREELPFLVVSLALLCVLSWSSVAWGAWVRRYNGPGNTADAAYAIAVDDSGNVYVTGLSDGAGSMLDYATIKYGKNGGQKWVRGYNGPGNAADAAYAIAVDGSGNVHVTGRSEETDSGADYLTIKYDTNGNQQWVRRYNGPGNGADVPQAIAVDGSGNVYVTGNSNVSATNWDYDTIKYDTNGNQQWARQYDGLGNAYDSAYAIAVDGKGNVYVTGETLGTDSRYDYATIKYGRNGARKWVRRYNGPGNSDDTALAIAVDGSGNVHVTGHSVSAGSGTDYLTIKYDTNGN